jgi:hypothetical protein
MDRMIARIHRMQSGIISIVNAFSICHFATFILFYLYLLVILQSDIIRNLIVYASHQILFGWSNHEEWDRQGKQHVWGWSVYRVSLGKFEGNRSLGRSRRRREDNIKTDTLEVGWGMDWYDLAQDRTGGWLLWMWQWTSGFHKTAGNFLTNRGFY